MTLYVSAILLSAACGLIYKGAMLADCRRMSLLLVERIVTVIGMFALAAFLPGYEWTAEALWLGLATGVMLMAGRLCFLQLLRYGGATSAWMISSLAAAVPVLASITLFKEAPTGLQIFGLLLAPPAVLLLRETGVAAQGSRRTGRRWIAMACLVICFEGLFVTNFKLVHVLDLGDSRHLVVLVFNAFALATVTGYAGFAKRVPNRTELKWGVISGFCTFGSGACWVNVLQSVPGIVFYPTACIATIVIVATGARFFFGERLSRLQVIGIVIAVGAILLILIG